MDCNVLNDLVDGIERFWAHIPDESKGEERPELLIEHTARVSKYFRKIWQEKQVDKIFADFCREIDSNLSDESKQFLQDLIWAIPVFHDLGKINPLFQREKMKNPRFKDCSTIDFDTKHSFLSAVLYIDYFQMLMKETIKNPKEKAILKYFLLCNAYIISRHHSDLKDILSFLKDFGEEHFDDILLRIEKLINNDVFHLYRNKLTWSGDLRKRKIFGAMKKKFEKTNRNFSQRQITYIYAYERLLYSMLLASDYYATAEYQNGIEIEQFGDIDEIVDWQKIYENTSLMQSVRKYQREIYPQSEANLAAEKNLNNLRSEIFCETEANLLKNCDENIFYLEAPTGSGKSNTAINLSFQLMAKDRSLKKLFYIYPFNTLVEQNVETLEKIFGNNAEIMQKIAVINSLTPIKLVQTDNDEKPCYQKALLDRQFLNYPLILSTHVSLFNTLFDNDKENAFGFYQLANSVIVLDEIQSYKNSLWGEIINFLAPMAKLLHMKIIIMSATLPNLNVLLEKPADTVNLLTHKEKFFANDCFKKRVELSYELLKQEGEGAKSKLIDIDLTDLKHHVQTVIERADKPQKILVEFITKNSAYDFWDLLKEDSPCAVELITGDDSLSERKRILARIKSTTEHIILVATQVIEAGVDIDMSVGYKALSKLDSEEQFLGRINRSCKNHGITYFFKKDNVATIYKHDKRSIEKFTLENPQMREILVSKDFQAYYRLILAQLKLDNKAYNENNLNEFFSKTVAELDFAEISKRMKLIDERAEKSVFLARVIHNSAGKTLDGVKIWHEYIALLKDFAMDYAEKQVKLSIIRSKMNEFIYQVRDVTVTYDDRIGDLYYFKDGQKYMDEKFQRKKIEGSELGYVDFV